MNKTFYMTETNPDLEDNPYNIRGKSDVTKGLL